MSVRRNTPNRLTLIRSCGICGKTFTTTVETPYLRTIKGRNFYYCSEKCKKASYTERPSSKRRAKDDRREYDKAYYQANKEKKLAMVKAYYAANRDDINAYRRKAWLA